MKLPTQAKSVDRSKRIAAANNMGVSPAFIGTALGIASGLLSLL